MGELPTQPSLQRAAALSCHLLTRRGSQSWHSTRGCPPSLTFQAAMCPADSPGTSTSPGSEDRSKGRASQRARGGASMEEAPAPTTAPSMAGSVTLARHLVFHGLSVMGRWQEQVSPQLVWAACPTHPWGLGWLSVFQRSMCPIHKHLL